MEISPNISKKIPRLLFSKSDTPSSSHFKSSPLKAIDNTIMKPSPMTSMNIAYSKFSLKHDDNDKENSFPSSSGISLLGNQQSCTIFGSGPLLKPKDGESPLKSSNARDKFPRKKFSDLLNSEENGMTPSKFSVVRNSLSKPLYPFPSKTPKKSNDVLSVLDFTSRDSGFEERMHKMSPVDEAAAFSKQRLNYEEELSESARDFDENVIKEHNFSDYEFDTLHDLEEYDTERCTESTISKYEIISTDSPNINSGHVSTIFASDFEFGSPIGDTETSTTFGDVKPLKSSRRLPIKSETTRMLNFDSIGTPSSSSFKFTPPSNIVPKRTPLKEAVSTNRNDLLFKRPIFDETPKKSYSFESDCISEMEDSMIFDIENENSPSAIPSSISALISCDIKNGEGTLEKATPSRLTSDDSIMKRPSFRRAMSLQQECESDPVERVRMTLFKSPNKTLKRTEASTAQEENPSKRRKSTSLHCIEEIKITKRPQLQRAMSDNEATIMMAFARPQTEPDLIGDFSRPFVLPLTESKHQDLKAIDSDTLAALIRGDFQESVQSFRVIDCRYPYEFDGGHIVGAENLYSEELVQNKLLKVEPISTDTESGEPSRHIVIFHCEFSTERGPKLCRYLRAEDRALNRDRYPCLLYPELYVLRGGYRHFHTLHAELCRPIAGGYISMLDPKHSATFRQIRAQTSRKRF